MLTYSVNMEHMKNANAARSDKIRFEKRLNQNIKTVLESETKMFYFLTASNLDS